MDKLGYILLGGIVGAIVGAFVFLYAIRDYNPMGLDSVQPLALAAGIFLGGLVGLIIGAAVGAAREEESKKEKPED